MNNLDDILEGCKNKDRISQEKLYRQFYPGLFALCKKFFDDNHDVLTALNNGMLKVYKNIDQYDPVKGNLYTWSYAIVRNTALTYLRDKQTGKTLVELTEHNEVIDQLNPFKKLEWKDIFFYLGKLQPSTRAVCTLFYIEEYKIHEIATQMDLSEGTVKWHLSESRSKLKTIFSKVTIAENE